MPELYLQSDMLNNMGLSQQQLMMQRGNMYRNYQMGAFLSDTSGEHLEGTRVANPYLRYYAQMQRDAMEYQRRVALQQQMMQRQMAVQQHQFMLDQQKEDEKIRRSKHEADQQVLEIRKLKDQVRQRDDLTQGQIDKITSDLDRKEYGLTGEAEPLVKKVTRNSNFFFPDDFPNKDLRGKPIPETYQVNTETGEETLLGTSGESTFNSLRAATEQNRRFDFDQEKERNANAQKFAEFHFKQKQLEKDAEKERIEGLPFRRYKEDDPKNRDTQWIGEDKAKELDTAATQEAIEAYISKRKADPSNTEWENAVNDGVQPKIKALEDRYKAEAINELKDSDSDTSKERRDSDNRMFDERFTLDQLGTGEMFAAQDPGMEQDMFDDPGMDFDPVDETYTLDEIA